jgi:hypothetical protein
MLVDQEERLIRAALPVKLIALEPWQTLDQPMAVDPAERCYQRTDGLLDDNLGTRRQALDKNVHRQGKEPGRPVIEIGTDRVHQDSSLRVEGEGARADQCRIGNDADEWLTQAERARNPHQLRRFCADNAQRWLRNRVLGAEGLGSPGPAAVAQALARHDWQVHLRERSEDAAARFQQAFDNNAWRNQPRQKVEAPT